MISLNNDKELNVVVGNNRKSTVWNPLKLTVSELYTRLEMPLRGTETLAEYLALSKADQDTKKDIGGFVGGRLNGLRRKADNVLDRCIVTLDLDTIPPFGTENVLATLDAQGYGYCVYSTRKHRPEAPRLRIVVVTDRVMTVDEYDAVSRRLAADIGITMADPTTFEASRLMYWPSCSADGEYIFKYKDAPFLDVEAVLKSYTDWRDWSQRPQVPGANSYQKLAVRQGDPESKTGIIGAFCRVYDVISAMSEFLPGIYEPVDTDPNRYTYLNGSTTGGAVIYDNGKFLYSHHATDPCGGRLVNAADLVRLHKYGHLDANVALDTPINRLPSYKAFVEFAAADKKVSTQLINERYEAGRNEFAKLLGGDGNGTAAGSATQSEDTESWKAGIKQSSQGKVEQTIDNIRYILDNDPLLKGRFALNKFAGRGEVLEALPWDTDNKRRLWSDTDSNGLYWYMEKQFAITKRGNIDAALDIHATDHAFNDVQDYLNALQWDGVPRLDTLLIDYLGAEDSEYTRAVSRKAFTAAVARAMEPGCKYDNMLILCGRQGLGKSTVLDKMSRGWFNDSIRTFEGKEASELLQGVWLVEVAELDAFRRTDVARIKQFLSLRADRYRAAYGRNVKELPRCCAFFGTCNQMDFLQDMTGNRRFWPVDVGLTIPVGVERSHRPNVWDDLSEDVIDQLWAEAKARWQAGEPLYLTGEVERQALEIQEQHREANPKEGLVIDFVAKEIPVDWQKWAIDRRRDWWSQATHGDVETIKRDRITAIEVWCELYNGNQKDIKRTDAREINEILGKIPNLERSKSPFRCGPYGSQRGFDIS